MLQPSPGTIHPFFTLHQKIAQFYANDPMIDNLFYHCTQCDLPVTIHIAPRFGASYGIVDEQGLPRLEKMLKKHKDMKLLGHSAPFWGEISKDLKPEDRIAYPKGKVTTCLHTAAPTP